MRAFQNWPQILTQCSDWYIQISSEFVLPRPDVHCQCLQVRSLKSQQSKDSCTVAHSKRLGMVDIASLSQNSICTCIDPIHKTILHYIIHFRMAKAHERPLAAVYTAVSREA